MPSPARIVAFGLGLAGALTASQAPEFAQQYRQRLGGAIDELRTVAARFERDAQAVGESRDRALDRLAGNPDELARRQGEGMRETLARLGRLEDQRRRMDEAGPFRRVAMLAAESDPMIARGALEVFEPAVPVTQEGAVSAAAGFGGAWGVAYLILAVLGRWWRAVRGRRLRPAGAAGS